MHAGLRKWVSAAAVAAVVLGALGASARAEENAWESLDAAGLVEVSKDLAKKGEASAEGRRRLAGMVLERYLGTPEASRTMTCGQWRTLAEALGKDVADEVRRGWREKLRGAFSEPKVLAAMKPKDAVNLTEALTSLGDKGADDTLVAWMTAGTGWQSAEPWALRMLAESLAKRGDATKPLRDRLVDHIGRTYLAGPQGTWKGGCYEWKVILQSLAGEMDARTRQQWIAKLRAAFLAPKALASQDSGIVFLWEVLDGLGDRDAHTVLAAWMQAGPAWQSAGGDDLARLACGLARGGEATQAQQARLLDHVLKVRLATPQTTREVSGWAWYQLVLVLGQGVDDPARRLWRERLHAAYGDARTLAGVRPERIIDLSEALEMLGDGKSYDVVLAAMAADPQWRSLDVYQTTRLCQRLAHGGAATKTQRLDLAAVVAARFLATPEAVRSVGRWDWKEWAGTLGKELDAGSRRQWVTRLRETFTKPEVLAAMPLGEVRDLSDALLALGDREAPLLVAAWVSGGTAWQSLSPGELAGLAASLFECGEGAKAVRLRLVEHLTREYLAAPESTRKASCEQWSGFIQSLAGELEPQVRRTWAGALRAAFTDPKVLASPEPGIVFLWEVLDGLGDRDACTVLAAWMQAGSTWQSAAGDDLARLAYGLERGGEAMRSQRARLLDHVLKVRLATPETTRKVSAWAWHQLVLSLEQGVDDPARRMWRERLRTTYGDAKTLAAMRPEQVVDLSEALDVLGDGKSYDVVLVAMSANPEWRSMDVYGITRLCQRLARGGDATKAQRIELAGVVATTHLAAPESARRASCGQWNGLVQSLAKELEPGVRRTWAGALRAAFADPKVLASLEKPDMLDLARALEALEEKTEAAYGVVVVWMAATPAWQSLKPGDLRELAEALDRGGEKTKAERLRLAEHLTGTYLASTDGVRTATCGEWRGLAGLLAKDMGPETRRAWTTGLRNAFADAKVLILLKAADVLDLVAALEALGDKEACGVVVVWMSGSSVWQSPDFGGLRGLAECLERGGEAAKAMRLRLAEHVTKSRLGTTEAIRGVTCGQWRGLAGSLAKDLDPAAREVWAEKIRGAFADPRTMASMEPQEVVSLAVTLESLGDKRVPDILTSWILNKK